MKICMIGHKTVPSRDGGIEIVVEELASRMVKEGHEVTLYNRKRKNNPSKLEYKGIKLKDIFTIDKKSLDAIVYSYFATKKAIKEAKKGKFDVIHFHAEGPCNFLYMFGKLGTKKRNKMPKVIVTIHGLDWQRGKWGGFGSKIILRGEKQAVKYADEIIVLSENVRNYFKEKYNRDTTFIPNGVSKPNLHEPELILNKWYLKKDDYILSLARMVPEKGIHYLVEAWKKLTNKEKNGKKLVIAGGSSHSSDYYEQMKNMVKDDSSIILTGFVQGQLLDELYSNAYLYVLPSDIEGMPMSLLEAQAYGNTCLVSNIDENMQVINDKSFTFEKSNINDLSNKLKEIISMKLTTHNECFIKYSWDDIVKNTIDIYKK